jgi:hypothetical protein
VLVLQLHLLDLQVPALDLPDSQQRIVAAVNLFGLVLVEPAAPASAGRGSLAARSAALEGDWNPERKSHRCYLKFALGKHS